MSFISCNRARIALPFVLLVLPLASLAQAGRLQLPNLDGLAGKAKESVDVQLDASMLRMAGQFMGSKPGENPADAEAIQEVLRGIQGIYVKSFEFDEPNVYPVGEVDKLRKQLDVPGWNRLVSVHQKDEHVDVFLRPGSKDGGLVVLVAEPRELTIVNIVGNVDMAKLAKLSGRFGVPNLMNGAAPAAVPALPAEPPAAGAAPVSPAPPSAPAPVAPPAR